jgi:hypothetical protein
MSEKPIPIPPGAQQLNFGPEDRFIVATLDPKTKQVGLVWGQKMNPLDLLDLAFYILQAMIQVLKGSIVSPIADATGQPFIHGINGGEKKD